MDAVFDALIARPVLLVFLGLGFPKQERLALALIEKLKAVAAPMPLFLLLGASYEFHAGLKKRAPMIFQKLGLSFSPFPFRAQAHVPPLLRGRHGFSSSSPGRNCVPVDGSPDRVQAPSRRSRSGKPQLRPSIFAHSHAPNAQAQLPWLLPPLADTRNTPTIDQVGIERVAASRPAASRRNRRCRA
ncbi:MAG: WecB/TagA/CpsF family glycosyltransferase [Flavobacteriales bacterium]|nr:WecB/TagA/CpsF family glycosyltransferase [Flavobacteriales bacterium]